MAFFIRVREMNRGRRTWTLGLDHPHCDRRPVDTGPASWGIHLQAIEEAAVWMLELDEGIANLDCVERVGLNGVCSWGSCGKGLRTSQVVKRLRPWRALEIVLILVGGGR